MVLRLTILLCLAPAMVSAMPVLVPQHVMSARAIEMLVPMADEPLAVQPVECLPEECDEEFVAEQEAGSPQVPEVAFGF
ncbi:hypothetical protein [Marivivens aquimaris]|uniref:hypothetical protein n=1 Tax=Marivivens aquimaris TaxID=2774876 RepID=UPI0018824B2F|nr:hypothetical protein [Marivivens aquimaris]